MFPPGAFVTATGKMTGSVAPAVSPGSENCAATSKTKREWRYHRPSRARWMCSVWAVGGMPPGTVPATAGWIEYQDKV